MSGIRPELSPPPPPDFLPKEPESSTTTTTAAIVCYGVNNAAIGVTPSGEKRKRGRPSKYRIDGASPESGTTQQSAGMALREPVKRKGSRPSKKRIDGAVSLGVSSGRPTQRKRQSSSPEKKHDDASLEVEGGPHLAGEHVDEFNDLHQKIAARYGRLDLHLPGYLPQTYVALTKELLGTISNMMQTKPSELSIAGVSQWVEIVKFAADAKFNVGWLSSILTEMLEFVSSNGVTAETVERQEHAVEDVKNEVSCVGERLNQARKVVEDLKKEMSDTSKRLEVACSELETLKGRQINLHLFSDLK